MGDFDYDLLVVNGVVVTDASCGELDIAVLNGKIQAVVARGSLQPGRAKRTIDAQGAFVTPGGIDSHVHLAEPFLMAGGRSADDYESGTRSAIAGGNTTVITFVPQSKQEPSLLEALAQTHRLAENQCYSDYSFHALCTNAGAKAISEFPELRRRGISSLKIFMAFDDLQLPDDQVLDVLLEARKNGITTLIHAENGQVISWMTRQLESRGRYDPKYHVNSHPPLAEIEATSRAIRFAEFIDVPILIVHVSSPATAQCIREAQQRGLPIFAETCPQYLFLTRRDLDHPGYEGAKCVCSPPPREGPEDHEGIWRALEDGTFVVLSSDHCPFLYDNDPEGKRYAITPEYPNGRFQYIPNGCPGVETRLPLAMSAGRLEMKRFVAVTSTNAAKLYGLYPKKGTLIPGQSDADITVWYAGLEPFPLNNSMLHHNVDYTPFEGRELSQWPRYTILRGEVVWDRDHGGVVGKKGFGEFIARDVSSLAGPLRPNHEWTPEDF